MERQYDDGQKIALGALLGLTAHLACAAPPTFCKWGEVTYFSCRLKGARVVSVCGSGAVEPSDDSAHRASLE